MQSISTLIKSLPSFSQSRIVSSGYALWVVWSGDLNSAVPVTLKDYGAFVVARDRYQSLWFAPNKNVLRAVARLHVMSRLNDMNLFVQVVPATFLVGYDLARSLSLAAEYSRQEVRDPDEFGVIIHPKLAKEAKGMPGISLAAADKPSGITGDGWMTFDHETSLEFETKLSWFFIIKPLGRLGDKDAILGWRDYYAEIQEVLQTLGLKYISDVKEGFVIIPLGDVMALRSMCNEMLRLIQRATDGDIPSWPIVMAAVPQEGFPFSADLPKKVGLDWDKLAPDVPHMRIRDGFLMEDWFIINEVRYGTGQDTLDSWCNIGMKDAGGEEHGTLHLPIPAALGQGQDVCFYCGLGNHTAEKCPSRQMTSLLPGVWSKLAQENFEDIVTGYDALGKSLEGDNPLESLTGLLETGKNTKGLLARCLFEINAPAQLRQLELVWRSRGKEWPSGFEQLAPVENDYTWVSLEALREGRIEDALDMLKQASLKYQRSYQPHSLLGFLYMETGDHKQAQFHWEECERLSYTALQQGYFHYLKARSLEVSGELKEASGFYRQAYVASPKWLDPLYRQAVCLVKMGFTNQAFDMFADLMDQSPHMFNRILVDPELERGRVHILNMLWEHWHAAEVEAEEHRTRLKQIVGDVEKRFDSEHKYYETAHDNLERMNQQAAINNYVPYRQLAVGLASYAKAYEDQVAAEIKRALSRLEYHAERLKEIQREAAWFPFPKLLLEFNRDFNSCVEKINWIRNQHLKVAENFRTAMRYLQEIEEHIEKLQGRLVTLRIVRDSTLFILLLGRNFVWLEIVGLGLALVTVPAVVYFSRYAPDNWLMNVILKEKWEFQKGLIIVLSVLALMLAAVKSALSFEKKKQDLFDKVEAELAAVREKRKADRRARLKKKRAGG